MTDIGNDPHNDLTVKVQSPTGGLAMLTIVGAVTGTRSVSVSVNGWPNLSVPMTGSGDSSPLIARSIPVLLFPGTNTIRLSNATAPAPDLDKLT